MEGKANAICYPDLSSRPFGHTVERIIAVPPEAVFTKQATWR